MLLPTSSILSWMSKWKRLTKQRHNVNNNTLMANQPSRQSLLQMQRKFSTLWAWVTIITVYHQHKMPKLANTSVWEIRAAIPSSPLTVEAWWRVLIRYRLENRKWRRESDQHSDQMHTRDIGRIWRHWRWFELSIIECSIQYVKDWSSDWYRDCFGEKNWLLIGKISYHIFHNDQISQDINFIWH